MNKNIFSVLQQDDSDDEQTTQTQKQVQPRPTKKEQRAEDKQKREQYGDVVQKEGHSSKKPREGPKVKNDYKSGEKRPYERHSGTGRQAFGNDYKKRGHGKGNVGTEKDKLNEGEQVVEEVPTKPEVAPEPREEIITLEEYMNQGNFNQALIQGEEKVVFSNVKTTDPNLKMVASREKESTTYSRHGAKAKDSVMQGKGLLVDTETRPAMNKKRGPAQKNQKLELNDKMFPALE